MAGEKQGDDFIAQLLVVHLAAVFIVSGEQHGKEIAFVGATRASFGYQAVNDRIDLIGGAVETAVSGCGQAIVQDPFQRRLRSKRFRHLREHLSDFVGFSGNVRIEERLDYNLERETQYVAMNITLLTFTPRSDHTACIVDHHVRIGADSLPMKCGLREASLPFPDFAFAGQQPLADEALKKRRPQRSRLNEVFRIRHQHIFDVGRVVEEVSG